jgi:hypothetical protein
MDNRATKQAFVWGSLLIFFGVALLVETLANPGPWVWVGALVSAGLIPFIVFLTDRADWGFLIPAYVLWAVAGLVALVTLDILTGDFVALYVLSAVALPFLVVFVRNPPQWWALIPAYVLLCVGAMVVLIEQGALGDLLIPAYVMFAVAIPFFVVYLRNPKHWWALIPGGITAVIGLSFLIAEAVAQYVLPVVLIIAGAVILLRHLGRRETAE